MVTPRIVRQLGFATALLMATALSAQTQKGKFTDNILHFAYSGDWEHLETMKALPLSSDERLMIDALTTTEGKRAAELYLKLLTDYPTSAFAPLCRERLAEYQTATKALAHLAPKLPPPSKPELKSERPAPNLPTTRYTLQFGSFSSRAAAELRANELKPKVKTRVLEVEDEKGQKTYKVRWAEFATHRDQARAFGQSLGVEFFVVEESK